MQYTVMYQDQRVHDIFSKQFANQSTQQMVYHAAEPDGSGSINTENLIEAGELV